MSTPKEKLEYRYKQAEFFNAKVRGTVDPFEAACYFTAFLAVFRSVFQQSEKVLRLPGEVECWSRLLNPWKVSNLSTQQQECERVLTEIRNKEIHVEAQLVEKKRVGGLLDLCSLSPPFSTRTLLVFEDRAGKNHRLVPMCDMGLGIVRKLLDDHFP